MLTTVPEDDELDELPPLDGDARDAPRAEVDEDEIDEPKGDATLDDATGEDDPLDADEVEADESDTGWLDEPADAKDLDLGDQAMMTFADDPLSPADAEEPGLGDEDYGFAEAPERGGVDAGADGPIDPDEELRAEDLPPLDADEEGEMKDAALMDAGFASDELLGLPWAAEPWARVGAPVELVTAVAVVCAARGAIAAGRCETGEAVLLRVDLEGSSQALAAEGLASGGVRAMAAEGASLAVIDEAGAVLVSTDGGARFDPVTTGELAADVVLAAGATWVRTPAGGLLLGRTGAGMLERREAPATVEALALEVSGAVAALVAGDAGSALAVLRIARDGSTEREGIDASEARSPALLAARGPCVAYAARRGGVVRRGGDGGWTLHAWAGHVTALAVLDDAGTLLAATYSDADDTTALVRLDPDGRAAIVSRIGASRHDPECDGRVVAMAHDEARGVVWLAGSFGLTAIAVR